MICPPRLQFPPLCASAVVAIWLSGCAGPQAQPDGDAGNAGNPGDEGDSGEGALAPPGNPDTGSVVAVPPDSGVGADSSSGGRDVSAGPAPSDASTPSRDANASGLTDGAHAEAAAGPDAGRRPSYCPAGPLGNPIPSGATPTRIAGVPPSDAFNGMNSMFSIIEGPVWIGDALYVSEILAPPNPPPSRILKVTAAGVVTVAFASSGSNGLAVDTNGNLYGAVHKDGSVSRFDLSTGTVTPVVTNYKGVRFDSPNDLAIRSDGNIYFSDPDYNAAMTPPQPHTGLYRGVPGSNAGVLIDAMLTEPNGVTLSLDESTIYVASTLPGGIYQYPVMADGSVGAPAPFAPLVDGDGMAIDCAGNLYVAVRTTNTVVVLDPSGAQIGEITVPFGTIPAGGVASASNVAFGGSDHKTLYISAYGTGTLKGLFQVALSIPGLPY